MAAEGGEEVMAGTTIDIAAAMRAGFLDAVKQELERRIREQAEPVIQQLVAECFEDVAARVEQHYDQMLDQNFVKVLIEDRRETTEH